MSELVEIVARAMCNRVLGNRQFDGEWRSYLPDALAALRAIEGAGYKVVGREATEGMQEAAAETAFDDFNQFDEIDFGKVLVAAFDAAPTVGEVE